MPLCFRFSNGETIPQEDFDRPSFAERRTQLLRHHHLTREPVFCLCRADTPAKLSSVLLGETFFLRRYADTANQHTSDCVFGEPPSTHSRKNQKAGIGDNTNSCVEQTPDGLSVRIESDMFPLRREMSANKAGHSRAVSDRSPKDKGDQGEATASTMTQGGLLRLLLEGSGLVEWHPWFRGKRNPLTVMRLLARAAHTVTLGRRSPVSLSSVLLYTAGQMLEEQQVIEELKQSPINVNGKGEMLFVGLLSKIVPTLSGKAYWVSFTRVRARFLMTPQLLATFEEKHPCLPGVSANGEPLTPVLALATLRLDYLEPNGRPILKVSRMSAISLSDEYIPCESGYEREAANRLTTAGVSFIKPLRYHAEDDMLPDFVFPEMEPEGSMEVWGREDPEYRARMIEKRLLYLRSQTPLLEWDAAKGAPFPDVVAFLAKYPKKR